MGSESYLDGITIKFYENFQENNSVALTLQQTQRWLCSLALDELKRWMKEKPFLIKSNVKTSASASISSERKAISRPMLLSWFFYNQFDGALIAT